MKTKKPRCATKILALVLSMLMLLGAMPVAFAAEGDIVVKWPTSIREIEYGQLDSEAGLNDDGEMSIPGKFEFHPTGKPTDIGVQSRPVFFVPEDTSMEPIQGATQVTVLQSKSAVLTGGVPTASNIQAGQKLSDSVIGKTGLKMVNYGKALRSFKCEWKEPDKAMNTAGTFTEVVICIPGTSSDQKRIAPIEIEIEIVVEGDASETVIVAELPKASQINVGQKLANSALTGGLVTKGGNPVAGTFAWKNSNISPTEGTRDYTVVFTPDDPAVCEPMEMQVSVTTVRPELKIIEWPTITAEFRGGCSVHDIVTLEGGSANVPGKFQVSPDNKNPEKMGPADVVILFVPDDRTNYDIVRKTFTVNFEAATPEPGVSVRFGANFDSIRRKEVYISGSLGEGYNTAKDQATGTLYMVLDGEKIAQKGRLSYSHTYVSEDTIAPGEHTVYTEYVAGENDVFKSAVSHVETFVVEAFPDVTINDSTGTVVNEYKAGATVKVTAAEHEKTYYDFTGWTVEGVELTEEEKAQQTISFTMPEGDVNLTANYKLNFKNFVKFAFEQIGAKLMALVMQGIEWIKGLLP